MIVRVKRPWGRFCSISFVGRLHPRSFMVFVSQATLCLLGDGYQNSWFFWVLCKNFLELISNLWGHSELKWSINLGNWFWHLSVGNRSIVLNFYLEVGLSARLVFAKNTNEGQQSTPAKSRSSNFFFITTVQCKIIKNCVFE